MAQEQTLNPSKWRGAVDQRLDQMRAENFVDRFWAKDGTLWAQGAVAESIPGALGWLDVVPKMRAAVGELEAFTKEIKSAGFERVVLAGMGGSSLAPYVLAKTLAQPGGIPLSVLDSTDPDTVLRIEREGPVEKALFVISSKSGTTAEPVAYDDYFFDKVRAVKGDKAGENFVAITDPNTAFEPSARQRNFRKIFLNFADIGGRFSALSYFGLVPAALMGIDVAKLLDRAQAVMDANRNIDGPAIQLGAMLGVLSLDSVDKCTFITPTEFESLGLWLEQLIAESTGKQGKGILPVAGESPGSPEVYGHDRVFAYIRRHGSPHFSGKARMDYSEPPEPPELSPKTLTAPSAGGVGESANRGRGLPSSAGGGLISPDPLPRDGLSAERARGEVPEISTTAQLDSVVESLTTAGFPIADITLDDAYDIATVFMHWEIATGVAGAVIGINAFDQPNVQESKDVTKKFIAMVEAEGKLPAESPAVTDNGIEVYGNATGADLGQAVHGFMERVRPGDFVTLQAYLTESDEMSQALADLQQAIRDRLKVACTCGYGPRFLHSTGQFHKGGPNKGHFIQLVGRDAEDAPLPGRRYSFEQFRDAQVRGDRETLIAHQRDVICIDLGADRLGSLKRVLKAVSSVAAAVTS